MFWSRVLAVAGALMMFRGTLRGDVIEGTFRSESSGFHHLPQSGRWRVKRSAR